MVVEHTPNHSAHGSDDDSEDEEDNGEEGEEGEDSEGGEAGTDALSTCVDRSVTQGLAGLGSGKGGRSPPRTAGPTTLHSPSLRSPGFGFLGDDGATVASTKPAAARSEVHSLDSHPSDVSDAEDNDNAERDVEAGSVDFHHHGDDPGHSDDTGSDVDDAATGGAPPRDGPDLAQLDLGLGLGLGLVGGEDEDEDDSDDVDNVGGSTGARGVRGARGVPLLSADCSEVEEGSVSGAGSSRRLFRGLSALSQEVEEEDGEGVEGGGVDVSEAVEVKDDGTLSAVDSEQATAGGSIVGLLELYIRQRGGRTGASSGRRANWSRGSVLTASTGVVSVECRPPTPPQAPRASLDTVLPRRTGPASHRSDVAAASASSNNSVISNVSNVSNASVSGASVEQYGWMPPSSRSALGLGSASGAASSVAGGSVGAGSGTGGGSAGGATTGTNVAVGLSGAAGAGGAGRGGGRRGSGGGRRTQGRRP